jgi:hypothetical protein
MVQCVEAAKTHEQNFREALATNSSTVSSREEQLQYWSRRVGLSPHEFDHIWRLYDVMYPIPRCDQQVPSNGVR